ncbi:hypothetical protein EW145_g6468 [Phellinidium pouzarii]|uniref:Major facilitator superfamily (MFS) profile domain-containing protein n=1 Tax=Phellinidium pouzarii TaxID=167371 RepID=A0A4V3XBT3_9AGAM|nr:hypothetical protein EW145_g6468 [Phellinidium pouzarii]
MATPEVRNNVESTTVRADVSDGATIHDLEKRNDSSSKLEDNQAEDSDSDGGFWGWMAVFGGWFVQFSGFGYLIMIPGSILFVFSLFMLSLAKPEKYYQIFLTHAIGVGIGSGMSYVPSVALLASHFKSQHKRALTMSLVASGSSFGGIIHPIMLNNLFNGPVGFANGVRASAGLIAGCLIIAISTMRVKKSSVSHENQKHLISLGVAVKKFSQDSAYIAMVTS